LSFSFRSCCWKGLEPKPPKPKKKFVQNFVVYLLSKGKAMEDFEGLRVQFIMLKVKPEKHWRDSSSWGIVESMNDVLLQLTHKNINIVTIF